ncbi:PDR/VanB family oxidoreductase [Aquibium microcysteis]|uniref:PDR/VanB family oxidoreductase n=1 Tax=Aquibium microcysteis TaxID=675281 RepID=UPI001AEF261B|nr:PDR/VanB family oxidoreductase [Aquibium microcysteis]
MELTLLQSSVSTDAPRDAVPGAAVMNDPRDQVLSIERVTFETSDVVVLELRRADRGILPSWTPGAHVDVILPSGRIRQYSLCGNPADRSRYRVAILREPAGRGGSAELHDIAREGTVVTVRGPRNHFELVPADRYLFVAGGIGITPILPMILAAEAAGAAWRLVYGGRTQATMAFLGEIGQRMGGEVQLLPEDLSGRPDLDALLAGVGEGEMVYGCGPAGMLGALEAAAERHGRSRVLHVERFGAAEDAVPAAGLAGDAAFTVELRRSGLSLDVPADRRLGDVLLDAGVPVPFSCQEGYCGSCETAVLEGVPDHRDTILTDEEKAEARIMMVCCGRSKTPRLVLDL